MSDRSYDLGRTVPVLDHGYVILRDYMGDDTDVANAARISYDSSARSDEENEKLLRYLMRHKHTSPFEMAEMAFEIKLPIFVMRQWIRHRTANVNEVSARYTKLPAEMFVPEHEDLQPQSKSNKQGRDGGYPRHEAGYMRRRMREANQASYDVYEDLLDEYDLSREMARGILPLNTYTKCVWKIDLHNLFHFLKLRTDRHAQKEIRAYADVLEKFVEEHFPICHKAWLDYSKNAYTCSRMEVDILRALLSFYMHERPHMTDAEAQKRLNGLDEVAGKILSQRELTEFREKFL